MKRTLPYILMSLALLMAVTGLANASRRTAEANRRLTEVYASALYESMEETQALSLSLEKVMVSSDAARQITLLCDIARTADEVQRCLTALPLSHEAMSATLAYINRLSDYALSLTRHVALQDGLDQASIGALGAHRSACMQLGAQLALANQEMAASGRNISLLRAFSSGSSPSDRPLESVGEPKTGIQYPSFGAASAEPRGLTGSMISAEDALAAARDFVGADRVRSVQPAPDTGGSIPAYGVTVMTDDVQLNLEITMQGGHVLWMMPETASFPSVLDIEACEQRAAQFLRDQGFAGMEAVDRQLYNGLCVLTFAPLQQDVLLYPDVIRIQARMDTGDIVGFEAHSYWMNHTDRELSAPALTEASARALLSAQVEASEGRLCILPVANGEAMCWEFPVRYGDAQYLIYIDAHTGSETEVKKLIPQESGMLTV